jgi:hypothetical protein
MTVNDILLEIHTCWPREDERTTKKQYSHDYT